MTFDQITKELKDTARELEGLAMKALDANTPYARQAVYDAMQKLKTRIVTLYEITEDTAAWEFVTKK